RDGVAQLAPVARYRHHIQLVDAAVGRTARMSPTKRTRSQRTGIANRIIDQDDDEGRRFHRASAAFRAIALRSSGVTPSQRTLPPFLPPWRPHSRKTARTDSVMTARRFLGIVKSISAEGVSQQEFDIARGGLA